MKLTLLAICITALASSAFASGDGRRTELKLLGLYDMTAVKSPDASVQANLKDRGDFGGGLLIEFPFGKVVGLELGALYQPIGFKYTDASIDTDIQAVWHAIQVPVSFKFHLGSIFTFGVGGFYSSAMGKLKTTGTVLGQAGYSAESDLTEKADYGPLFSLGFNFKLGSRVSLILEGRAAIGMKQVDFSTSNFKTKHFQGLAGFGISL